MKRGLLLCILHSNWCLNGRVRVVALDDEVLVGIVEDGRRAAQQAQLRIGAWLARQLKLHLLAVISVDVTVSAGPDEVADLEVALLRQHVS